MWVVPMLWAGAFLTGASALERLSSDTVSFARFAITVIGGACVLHRPILTLLRAKPSRAAWGAMTLLALTGGVVYHILFYLGLARSEAPVASVVIATNPILTALGCAIFLRDRKPTRALFVGLGLAFLGAVLLAADRGRVDPSNPSDLAGGLSLVSRILRGWGIGETLCLLASISWAIFAVLLQRFRSGVLAPFPSAGVTFAVYAITALILLPVTIASGGIMELVDASPREWGCLVYLGLIATVVAYTMYNAAIDRVGSARVSQVTYAVPTFTTLLSAALFGFRPGASGIAGLVIVTLGLIVSDGRVVQALRARASGWRTPR